MNIFILDKNPEKAARMLCDKHIVKMILESSQMLCTAHWITGGEAPYKPTHKNHPCSKWVRESLGNYNWLLKHAFEMVKEYKKRYKKECHKCIDILNWCKEHKPKFKLKKLIPFVQAMPDKYKERDAVQAYRTYYLKEKLRFCKWNHSKKPDFVKEYEKE